MSRNGTLLDVTQPAQLADAVRSWVNLWPSFEAQVQPYPRSKWLREVEALIHGYYPSASSADLRLTARGLAPFWLRDGPNVP